VAGENTSGNLQPLQTDAGGNLLVSLAAEPGAPFATNITQFGGNAVVTGTGASGLGIPRVTVSSDSSLTNITGTISLPTGAATNAELITINSTLGSPFQAGGSIGNTAFGAIQSGVWNINNIAGTISLPTGAATNAELITINSTLGSPFQAGGSIGNTAFGATQSGPWTVAVNNFPATQPISGTVTADAGTPPALTVYQAAITVGTSAVRLTVSGSAPAATRVALVATPDSTATGKFYIGSSTVTSSGSTRGIQIVAGQTFIANNDAGNYWIISDTAAQIVEVMEQY
jgi:hypothetical protein